MIASSLFTPSVLASRAKFTPPRLPRILVRPRLQQRLAKGLKQRHVVLLGQAAQGKTTLAAAYLEQSEVTSVWINLEWEDSDPVSLFLSLVRGLDLALPGANLRSAFAVSPEFSQSPRSPLAMYRVWVRTLLAEITAPLHLVFDGLDHLSEKAASLDLFQVLLREAPPPVRLILLSRSRPDLNLEELRIRRQVLILENRELAFTTQEVGDFFEQVPGIQLPDDKIDKVQQLVEGWAGGLILLSEYLDRLDPQERDRYLEALDWEEYKRDVFLYFANHIFADLEPETKEFMAHASLFEVLEPSLIHSLQPSQEAGEALRWLARRNLFVSTHSWEPGGSTYRFHRLFQEFLRSWLESKVEAGQMRALLVRAAQSLNQNGNPEPALKLYLRAREWDQAAALIHHLGFDLLRLGRTADLAHWIGNLPKEMVSQDPLLELFLCMTRRWTAMDRNLEALPRINAALAKSPNPRAHLICLALWLETGFRSAAPWSQLLELIQQSQVLLESAPAQPHLYERGRLWAQIGLCLSIRGNPRQAVAACQNAYLAANSLEDITLQCESLPHYINALVQLGQFSRAQKLMARFEQIAGQSYEPAHRAQVHLSNTLLHIYKGEARAAKQFLDQAQELVEEQGLVYLHLVALLYHLMWAVSSGNLDLAHRVGTQLAQLTAGLGILFFQGVVSELMGLAAYERGDVAQAAQMLEQTKAMLRTEKGHSEMHLHGASLMAALVHSHLDPGSPRNKSIRLALDYFQDIACPGGLAEGHFCAGLVSWRQGQHQRAARHLQRGLKQVESMEAPYFLWISRSDLARVCSLALELDIPRAAELTARMAATDKSIPWEPALGALERRGDLELGERVSRARLCLRRRQALPLRVETLGGFRVLRGGVPLTAREWRGKRSKQFLKVLIARGARQVPKDLLMKDLWPQVSQESGENSFKVALHRVRKILEPGLDNSLGPMYLRLDDNSLSLDPELCSLDLDDFERWADEGRSLEKQGRLSAALEKYRQAAALYQGDFLPQDLYEAWTQPPRERMREKYLNLLMTGAALHQARGSLDKACAWHGRALRTDPCLEEVYRRLMKTYQAMGKPAKAMEVFLSCQKAMREHLDAEPDQTTIALYRAIRGKNNAPG